MCEATNSGCDRRLYVNALRRPPARVVATRLVGSRRVLDGVILGNLVSVADQTYTNSLH